MAIRNTLISSKAADMHDRHNDNDDVRWQQLSNRQWMKASSAEFIYAVKTTGVYCLPGCASRLPRRENVTFYDDCQSALKAGFRPCKRCEPDKLVDSMSQTIEQACRLIEDSSTEPTLKDLSNHVGVSAFHLHRQFKKYVGMTPKQYAAGKRRGKLQSSLATSSSVTEAIYDAGYNSPSRVYDRKSTLGLAPAVYRKGAAGTSIHYTISKSSLGMVLIAATERGICCVELGDSKAQLEESLKHRFPRATIVRSTDGMEQHCAKVINMIENPSRASALPLDIQGTAFQMRVWDELQKVPAGSTTTYADIAERIGEPTAVRAVARAIASNKIAIAIPCHRIICKSGDLSGYRWGVERKQRLLDRERI